MKHKNILKLCLLLLSLFLSVPLSGTDRRIVCFAASGVSYDDTGVSYDDTVTSTQTVNGYEEQNLSGSETKKTAAESTCALVTKIQKETELAALPTITLPLRSLPGSENLDEVYLLALKYRTVSASVTEDDKTYTKSFSVAWDFSSINQTVEGEYFAVGVIELPDGYAFAEGVLCQLQIPVIVKEMPPAVITSVDSWYPYTNAYAFVQDSEPEALEELFVSSPYYMGCYDENGACYYAEVEWDLSGIDFHTVGLYDAKGTLTAPEDTVFSQELELPDIFIPISIQAADKPDINCIIVGRGSLLFPWVTPPGNLDEIRVWLSEDNGTWVCVEDGFYADSGMLSLGTYLLTPGSSYRLQVDYEGGKTGILSFTYADEILLEGYHDGDRDGGDANGNPSIDVTQPAPEGTEIPTEPSDSEAIPTDTSPLPTPLPSAGSNDEAGFGISDGKLPSDPKTEASKDIEASDETESAKDIEASDETETAKDPEASDNMETAKDPEASDGTGNDLLEFFGETTDRILGTRFFMMLQAGNQRAIFSKHGITVSIPAAALPDSIQKEDQIEVSIQKETDDSFSFLFSINGAALDFLPDVLVMIPYSTDPTTDTLQLLDENDASIPMTDYDDTTKTASFVIDHTGTYHTTGTKEAANSLPETVAASGNRQTWWLFLLPAGLICLPAGATFLRRRSK